MHKCLATLVFAALLAASGCIVVPHGGYRREYSGRHYDAPRDYRYDWHRDDRYDHGRHGGPYDRTPYAPGRY